MQRDGVNTEGFALRLRPVRDDDAALIVALRNDPALARWLHAGAADVPAQRAWLAARRERAGDHYFVVEPRQGGAAEGLIAIYDIEGGEAEWGRWVLRPGSLAAVESAWLNYRFGFETLGLGAMHCRTVADNTAVVSFHDGCGIAERRVLPAAVQLRGRLHDAVEHRVPRAAWPALSTRLSALAERMARRLERAA